MATCLKVTVRYDGTGFAGWQVQPDVRTVQGELQSALSQIASQPMVIHGASRTDAGVHALGQVFSCAWPGPLGPDRLRRSLSQMLSPEIRVERVEEALEGFHARHHAKSKRYAYTLSLSREPDPFSARYAWCISWALDLDRLAELARRFEGEHDFAGFQAGGAPERVTTRTLYNVKLSQGGTVGPCGAADLFHIEYCGDGFLYKMVRNLTGTLVDVTRGAVPESRIGELLASAGPYRGHTAPAHGLALLEVLY
jgi:tRNA pseudouridine38-40 synthase